jgi:serine/threonine protein kinase
MKIFAFQNELELLQELSHENILGYVDHFTHDNKLYLALEYASQFDHF